MRTSSACSLDFCRVASSRSKGHRWVHHTPAWLLWWSLKDEMASQWTACTDDFGHDISTPHSLFSIVKSCYYFNQHWKTSKQTSSSLWKNRYRMNYQALSRITLWLRNQPSGCWQNNLPRNSIQLRRLKSNSCWKFTTPTAMPRKTTPHSNSRSIEERWKILQTINLSSRTTLEAVERVSVYMIQGRPKTDLDVTRPSTETEDPPGAVGENDSCVQTILEKLGKS